MIDRRVTKAMPPAILAASMLAAGCLHRSPAAVPPAPVSVTQEIVSAPVSAPDVRMIPNGETLPPEPYIDLQMADAPVRLILQELARMGKLDLILPPNLTRTLSVEYVHVPVSVALKDVLRRSGLQLGAGTTTPLPFDTVTVFYHLPANIDSMSVDAIMRRFGVSRTIAEMLAKTRKP